MVQDSLMHNTDIIHAKPHYTHPMAITGIMGRNKVMHAHTPNVFTSWVKVGNVNE